MNEETGSATIKRTVKICVADTHHGDLENYVKIIDGQINALVTTIGAIKDFSYLDNAFIAIEKYTSPNFDPNPWPEYCSTVDETGGRCDECEFSNGDKDCMGNPMQDWIVESIDRKKLLSSAKITL